MKVFISYDHTDRTLARKIAEALKEAGLEVWYQEDEIYPGDNWAAKMAQGLEAANAMVVVWTRNAFQSDPVRWSINYALGDRKFAQRLITVFADDPDTLPEAEVPWILRRLKTINLSASGGNEEGFKQIAQSLQAAA